MGAAEKLKIYDAVDLFCGAGGATEGVVAAFRKLGILPEKQVRMIAVNHWDIAVDTHRKNHPWSNTILSGIDAVRPRQVCPSGRVKILVAGPSCTHHAKARGGRPMNEQSRTDPWLIMPWLHELYVDNFLIENVEELLDWGPLGANQRPLKSKKGETFRAWIDALRRIGYNVEYRVICSADYGDATTRKRLWIMGRRGNKKVVWPEFSHAKDPTLPDLFVRGPRKPWRAAKEIIDWTNPGKSIFLRKKPLKPTTIARIEAGLSKFLGEWAQPFIIALRQHCRPRSIDEPVNGLSAQGTHLALVQPKPFIITPGGTDLGVGRDVDQPLATVMGNDRFALVDPTAFLLQQQSGGAPRSVEDPAPTIAGKGAISMVNVNMEQLPGFIVPYYGERPGVDGRAPQAPRVHDVNEPLPTQPCTPKFAVMQPKAFLVSPGHGEGDSTRRSHDIDKPLKGMTGSNEFAIVDPKAFLVEVNHTGKIEDRSHDVDDPLKTQTTKNGMAIVQATRFPFLVKFYSNPKYYHQSIEAPLGTITSKERFGVVDPQATVYGLDILFRMLTPSELAAAMSFPKSYVFCGGRTKQTKMIGNAWPIETATALCLSLLD